MYITPFLVLLFGTNGQLTNESKPSTCQDKQIRHAPVNLSEAVERLDFESVRRLVETGSSRVDTTGESGESMLMKVMTYVVITHSINPPERHELRNKIAMYLVKRGANVNHHDKHGQTPLMRAVSQRYASVIRELLKRGADVNASDMAGETALMKSCGPGSLPIVRLLVLHGADVNAQDTYGFSPIYVAAESGDVPLIRFLLEKGADVHRDTQYGGILSFVNKQRHPDVYALLLKAGGSLTKRQ